MVSRWSWSDDRWCVMTVMTVTTAITVMTDDDKMIMGRRWAMAG